MFDDVKNYLLWLRSIFPVYGAKALYKQFRYHVRRPFSRGLIREHAPAGRGLEIGVGRKTIAPMTRTLLSDAHAMHVGHTALATEFFRADAIPYPDSTFAFVLSEHALEHCANPLKVLREWIRVLQPGGVLVLFLPHKERTFDKLRSRTPLAHLIEDERLNISDGDTTHFPEWKNFVLTKNLAPHYANLNEAEWTARAAIHHHVWITEDMLEIFRHLGLEIVYSNDLVPDRNDSFVVVGRKRPAS